MKLKIGGFDVEGTPQEVKNLLELLKGKTERTKTVKAVVKPIVVRNKPSKKRYPNKYKPWNKAQDDAVNSSLSVKRIAKQLGKTKAAVYSRRYQLKIKAVKQNGK
jgi:hypothetical protein